MTDLVWWIFASLAVGGGLGMVTSKNPVASLLFLVMSFFSLAVLYVLLDAHFIAAIQVIVYAGAIMVLFLFAVMLLNLGEQYRRDLRAAPWVLAGSAAAGVLGWLIWRAFAPVEAGSAGNGVLQAALRERDVVSAIAMPLFQEYLVPFEVTSVLLLVAAVGAVLLAKRRV